MERFGTADEKGLQSCHGKDDLKSEKSKQRVLAGIWKSPAQPWSACHAWICSEPSQQGLCFLT